MDNSIEMFSQIILKHILPWTHWEWANKFPYCLEIEFFVTCYHKHSFGILTDSKVQALGQVSQVYGTAAVINIYLVAIPYHEFCGVLLDINYLSPLFKTL